MPLKQLNRFVFLVWWAFVVVVVFWLVLVLFVLLGFVFLTVYHRV